MKPKLLDKLIKLTKDKIDQLLIEKVKIEKVIDSLEKKLLVTEKQFESEKNLAQTNPMYSLTIGLMIKSFKDKMTDLKVKINRQQDVLEAKNEEIREQFREQKKFEKLKEELHKKELAKIAKLEEQELDEMNMKYVPTDAFSS